MKGKVRLALALSLLLAMVSTFAAEARPAATVSVGSWTYLKSVGNQFGLRADRIDVNHAPRSYWAVLDVQESGSSGPGDVGVPLVGKKSSPSMEWLSNTVDESMRSIDPNALVFGHKYVAKVYVFLDPDRWSFALSEECWFVAGTEGCQPNP